MSTSSSLDGGRLAPLRLRMRTAAARVGKLPARQAAIAAGGIFAVAGIAFGTLHTPLFAIDRIDVTGAKNVATQDVLSASGLKKTMPAISVDENVVERRLEALPWVKSAAVSTHWPHRVSVSIVERRPVAQAPVSDGRWVQIGEDGIVLALGAAPVANLPVPLGLNVVPTPGLRIDSSGDDLLQVALLMPQSMQLKVTQIQKDEQGNLRLGLNTDTVVELGDKRDLAEKLMAAAAVLSHLQPKELAALGILDVRSPHLPLSTPKGADSPNSGSSPTTTPQSGGASGSSTSTTMKPKTASTVPKASSSSPGATTTTSLKATTTVTKADSISPRSPATTTAVNRTATTLRLG